MSDLSNATTTKLNKDNSNGKITRTQDPNVTIGSTIHNNCIGDRNYGSDIQSEMETDVVACEQIDDQLISKACVSTVYHSNILCKTFIYAKFCVNTFFP